MTQSGNKPSNSEIRMSETDSTYVIDLTNIRFNVQYTILHKEGTSVLVSPFEGFLNILYPESNEACIVPYFLNLNAYLIRGGQNIIHVMHEGDKLEWKNVNKNNVAIAIFIPSDIILDFSTKFSQQIKRFKNGLLTKSDSRLVLLYKQILELNEKEDHLYHLRIQSLIIDTLVHQIEGFFAENDKQEIIVNKTHYDKIILAKEFIDRDLSKNFTIAELSKLVGTNEQYLKKYFKQYFGKTVMNYITDQKMNHAKELIMTGKYRVSDVANLTGYKHSTHFTTAFKRRFGFIPNSLKYTFLIANEGTNLLLTELESLINIL